MKKTALIGFGSLALWAMFVMLSFGVVGCTGPGGNNTDGGTTDKYAAVYCLGGHETECGPGLMMPK